MQNSRQPVLVKQRDVISPASLGTQPPSQQSHDSVHSPRSSHSARSQHDTPAMLGPLSRPHRETQGIELDPHMATHSKRGIGIRHVQNTNTALRYLEHRILIDPTNFKSHVKRIALLSRSPNHADQLFSALIDLFLALEDKGHGLKHLLLQQARPIIGETSHYMLSRFITRALPEHNPMIQNSPIPPLINTHKPSTLKLVRIKA